VWKAFEILVLILLPLGWGVGVEFLFERAGRKRNGHFGKGQEPSPYDWVI